MTMTLSEMAVEVLTTANGRAKAALGRRHASAWFAAREAGAPLAIGEAVPPLRPFTPEEKRRFLAAEARKAMRREMEQRFAEV